MCVCVCVCACVCVCVCVCVCACVCACVCVCVCVCVFHLKMEKGCRYELLISHKAPTQGRVVVASCQMGVGLDLLETEAGHRGKHTLG